MKTDEELAAMQKAAEAANKALADVVALYARWMRERPTSAAYPYALAFLIDSKNETTREQLLLEAAALDPKLTEPFTELINLTSGYDDEAALKYAKKALDLKPDDVRAQLTYARNLWAVDQATGRRYYDDLLERYAGTKDGATTIQQFISGVEDPAEKAALVERFRREYPNDWNPDYYENSALFSHYVSLDPQIGLGFAREILAMMDKPQPGRDGRPPSLPGLRRPVWTGNLEYAQAIVEARALVADGKGSEALVGLEKVLLPGSVAKSGLEVLRAEATAASGDVAKAYEMLVTLLAADFDESAHDAALGCGAKLGKTPNQVDNEVWARRMQKAEVFADFDLARLGSQGRVKLSDLRGKVVLVDFWFPG